jgi:SAM-dependent methyltransferase
LNAEETYATVARVAKQYVPRAIRPAIRYCGFRISAFVQSVTEHGTVAEEIPLPPPLLRYRVHGTLKPEHFSALGRMCVDDLNKALNFIGKNFESFSNVLDFGCGCGRTLRHLSNLKGPRLYGTDIDRKAIQWCGSHIPFCRFTVNDAKPPLPFPADNFDLIYGISVFTHLDEDYQFAWIGELKRVAKSGAILLLTVHGTPAQEIALREGALSVTELTVIRKKGFLFKSGSTGTFKLDGLPDFYQTAFHTKAYLYGLWGKFFRIRGYLEGGLIGHQDLVVLSND